MGAGHNVLIVDDQASNLALLSRVLREQGFTVRAVTSGSRALEAARLELPDCVLLDVNMPDMDGFEVCSQFMVDPQLAEVPIIFLTAHDDAAHKTRAFEAGGRDYISKPFEPEEVTARVRNQLRIKELERLLREQADQIAEANLQLRETAKVKQRITATLVHDIRGPLMAIGAVLDMRAEDPDTQDAFIAFDRISALLDEMLAMSKSEHLEERSVSDEIDLIDTVQTVIRMAAPIATARGVRIVAAPQSTRISLPGNRLEIERALSNLLGNAIKFSPAHANVGIDVHQERGCGVEEGLTFVAIAISDQGPGIPAEELPFIFDPYRQGVAGDARAGVGLGLSIVARIVASHGGRIQIRSRVGVGSEFRVLLPLHAEPRAAGTNTKDRS